MYTLSLTLDVFSTYPLFKLTEGEPTEIYRNRQLFFTHNNMCLNVCQVGTYTKQKRFTNLNKLLYLHRLKCFIDFLWKLFQDLEPGSVYVKIIEYSIAGQSFLTDDIWEKILLKNRSSAFKKMLKSISTFKVGIYFVWRIHVKMYCKTHRIFFRKYYTSNRE